MGTSDNPSKVVLPIWHYEVSEDLEFENSGFSALPTVVHWFRDPDAPDREYAHWRTFDFQVHFFIVGFAIGFDPFWWRTVEDAAEVTPEAAAGTADPASER